MSTLRDTHFKIATRLRLVVPLCTNDNCGAPRLSVQSIAGVLEARRRRRNCGKLSVAAQVSQPTSNEKTAEFAPGDFRRISQHRGVAGDLPVHLDVVVTSTMHKQANEWHAAGEGEPVSREVAERGNDEILGCTARLVSLAFESQARW